MRYCPICEQGVAENPKLECQKGHLYTKLEPMTAPIPK
jgi:hypothetical protein